MFAWGVVGRYFSGDIIVNPYATEIDVMEFLHLMSFGILFA